MRTGPSAMTDDTTRPAPSAAPTPAVTTPSADHGCCTEYAATRRSFLRTLTGAAGATMFGSAFLQTTFASPAEAATGGNVLVVLSLRGGADMLSLVVPHGDPGYYDARPTLAIPKGGLIGPKGMFGLHPALWPLKGMWERKQLAAVTAVGLPVPNRSHFDAMERVEDANPGDGTRTGWLNRMIGLDDSKAPTQGTHIGSGMIPTSLYGVQPALATPSLDQIALTGPSGSARADALRQVWAGTGGDLGRAARSALDTARRFRTVAGAGYRPANGASYPASDLGDALKEAARLIKAGLGVKAITVDYGSWDMHANLGRVGSASPTSMHEMTSGLAHGLKAFFTDLGAATGRVTLVTLTEFGRRVSENGSGGLDHGWGNAMLVMGGGVRGGEYYGKWPGLGPTELRDGDLAVTTDYRSVLAEVLRKRFNASIPTVFPGLSTSRLHDETVGVMA
jgi:uncharacterized protein (DUF1501 family)